MNFIVNLIKLSRPVHWIKNLSLFAALVFTQELLDIDSFLTVFWAFWVFNFAASSVYAFNDAIDYERDREHPIKKRRPVASGAITPQIATAFAVALAGVSILWAQSMNPLFASLVLLYIGIQIIYSLFLKNLYIIDILVIAAGFVIRVYAGAFVIDAHLSVWFLLSVSSVALFLAAGKRRAELGAMGEGSKTRKTLSKYPRELLNSYVTMFGSAAWLSWALFTFFESPRIAEGFWIFLAELSQTTSVNKLLMITIPVAIFAVMRYQAIIFEDQAESPERILLTDIPLISSILMWGGMVVFILYAGVATF